MAANLSPEEMRAGHKAVVEDLGGSAEQWISEHYVHHDPLLTETSGVATRAEYITAFRAFKDPMPDQVSTAELVLADGDYTSARWSFRGTLTGEFRGMPPTGQEVTFWGLTTYRWEDGKIAEGWTLFDVMGFMTQVGLMPATA